MKRFLWTVVTILFTVSVLAAQDVAPPAPAELEESLKARVSEFYGYFQQGDFRAAEALVAQESRDPYYRTNKQRILGFQIEKIDLSSDRETAKVRVNCRMMAAHQGAIVLNSPMYSRWKLVGGDWFFYVEADPSSKKIATPFGEARITGDPGVREPQQGSRMAPVPRVAHKSLRQMYKLEAPKVLTFPTRSTEVMTQSVKLINPGPARLSLRREGQEVQGLVISQDPVKVEPGQNMTISFTYHPEVARLKGTYLAQFTIIPLNQPISVLLEFAE